MKISLEILTILIALAIACIAGYFLYDFIERLRLDLYCNELREGLDCYQENWVRFPAWLFSVVGASMASLSIYLVFAFLPTSKVSSSKKALFIGAIIAFPLTFLLGGVIAFLVTVFSGVLTRHCLIIRTRNLSK